MKKKFSHFYPPSEKEIKNLWDNCLFTFDTNVLLNLYRYSNSTRNDFLKILKGIESRIWVPYQVGFEFHNNRISTINTEITHYKKFIEELTNIETNLNRVKESIEAKRNHPHLKANFIDNIKNIISKKKKEVEKEKRNYEKIIKKDSIGERVTRLFNNKVGENYTQEKYKMVIEEGEYRYKNKIPPGYEDEINNNKIGFSKYGDLFIWFQIIEKAKECQKPIILITDDEKSDWWKIMGKKKLIGPRPELIQEFRESSNVSFFMYHSDDFLILSRKYLSQKVNETTIIEATKTREVVNERNDYKHLLNNLYQNQTSLSNLNSFNKITDQFSVLKNWNSNLKEFQNNLNNIGLNFTENYKNLNSEAINFGKLMNSSLDGSLTSLLNSELLNNIKTSKEIERKDKETNKSENQNKIDE